MVRKDCTSSEISCFNCGGSHASCSRSCPQIKVAEYKKQHQEANQQPTVTSVTYLQAINQANKRNEQQFQAKLEENVSKIIEEKIATLQRIILDAITNLFTTPLGNTAAVQIKQIIQQKLNNHLQNSTNA